MSKIHSLAALTVMAAATFTQNAQAEKVFATADGNLFLSENYARNHGRQEKLEVYTITRAEALASEPADDSQDDDNDDSQGSKGSEGAADAGSTTDKAAPAKKPAAKTAPAKKPTAAKAAPAKKADAPADASAGKPEEAAQ